MVMAHSQTYPNKPIGLVVPFAPGGTTDIIARVMSESLSKNLGQPLVIVNKPGGAGSVGALEVIRAPNDGYTLGMATVSTTAAGPAINPKTPYNPLTDLTPITNIAATPNVILVHPSFPARDYASFLKELKANPGKYSYATAGTGSIGHLLAELFKSLTQTFMVHIPYPGAGPALRDLVAGQVEIMVDNLPSALPFIQDKKLIPIVIMAPYRLPSMPSVPTFKEVGLEAVNRLAYYGLHGPKNLPKDLVDKIYAATKKSLEDPSVRKKVEDTGAIIVANTPAEFTEQIHQEYKIFKELVDKQKLKLE
ncbi:MAG: tripartite tricarboxylate transporter substrate binding protein BugE [Gammaproteobacteria bacterium]|nr:tripartite tricarboxylate transporter substrate binding protein BugE [Gammaproteobacteria bacterium]